VGARDMQSSALEKYNKKMNLDLDSHFPPSFSFPCTYAIDTAHLFIPALLIFCPAPAFGIFACSPSAIRHSGTLAFQMCLCIHLTWCVLLSLLLYSTALAFVCGLRSCNFGP